MRHQTGEARVQSRPETLAETARHRFRSLPTLSDAEACLLAARSEATRLATLPGGNRPTPALLADTPPADLATALPDAALLSGETAQGPLRPERIAPLWPVAPALEFLLTQGGDDRLTLDPVTGRNRYLCAPRPEPARASLSSCTASPISPSGFAAAGATRDRLIRLAAASSAADATERLARETEAALLRFFGAESAARAVLTPSGTDATLLLTSALWAEQPDRPLLGILMAPEETGSGVPDAVRLRAFSALASSGRGAEKSRVLPGMPEQAMVTVALREADGSPRAPAAIAAETERCIAQAIEAGMRPVLHAIEGSKTGLAAPDRETLARLAARFGEALTIVVDACQARLEPALIRRMLERGWPVLITGSKFYGAPPFCGAILLPHGRGGEVPEAVRQYVGPVSPGLLLRWAAALDAMTRFAALETGRIQAGVERFARAARSAIFQSSIARMVPSPRPAGLAWSGRPSVFTFAVRRGGEWASPATLRPSYLALAEAGLLVGQPVALGTSGLGGLRLALSVPDLVAGTDPEPAITQVFAALERAKG